jgi:hypothetical protein
VASVVWLSFRKYHREFVRLTIVDRFNTLCREIKPQSLIRRYTFEAKDKSFCKNMYSEVEVISREKQPNTHRSWACMSSIPLKLRETM